MIIHLHALCWNEEKMLPHFFKHYDGLVDAYFIYDNGSSDRSLTLLHSHPKVTVNRFDIEGASLIESALAQFNSVWKRSVGKADWVIVCDIDEHLYHPDLRAYLEACAASGVTLIVPEGYEMVADAFPDYGSPLCEQIQTGVRDGVFLDKPQLFNPNAIGEINFAAGRHSASPVGNVIEPSSKEVKLLHYKYLGFDYLSSRLTQLRQGLRMVDIANHWGVQYMWAEQQKRQVFESLKRQAVKAL
ncbi:glycosyltransferase family 2 protein [Paenibacillus piri]|uniref:Glycosyltransferase family 2 protein n=1 Tax=Paenibacillus piri TaxID=2547395 RepID=A0A4R5KAT6_9BACL|nr:glycosyltransferase family 2 protein [Paenibacillus piri]TDF92343.1 glycosyltransferase family 2 protein [Paenibacillus piri]